MNYQDIYVVDSFEEAEQFKYEQTGESVEVGTPVAYDKWDGITCTLTCFEGIYFSDDG